MDNAPEVIVPMLRRCARADSAAFERLYECTQLTCSAWCCRWWGVGEAESAESITREVYAEVWRTCSRFTGADGEGMAWMLAIAHRRAVAHVRASPRAPSRRHHEMAVSGDPDDARGRPAGASGRLSGAREPVGGAYRSPAGPLLEQVFTSGTRRSSVPMRWRPRRGQRPSRACRCWRCRARGTGPRAGHRTRGGNDRRKGDELGSGGDRGGGGAGRAGGRCVTQRVGYGFSSTLVQPSTRLSNWS